MSTDVTPNRSLSERVAEEIRVAMTRQRRSGAWLARQLGVSSAWVSYRLTGAQPIDLNDLERIAAALGVNVQELIPRGRYLDITHTPAQVTHKTVLQRASRRPPTRPADLRPVGRSGGSSRPNARLRTSRIA